MEEKGGACATAERKIKLKTFSLLARFVACTRTRGCYFFNCTQNQVSSRVTIKAVESFGSFCPNTTV